MSEPLVTNGPHTGEPLHEIYDPVSGRLILIWSSDPLEMVSAFMQIVGPMPAKPVGMQGSGVISNYDVQSNTTSYVFDPGPKDQADLDQQRYATEAAMWIARMNMLMEIARQFAGMKEH